eukprot:TRINITY_DN10929_c0_g1_i11.p1 TRINITY_DN10929_c0_g1~~TRINITY_DN10929_c0_g1_i11.p1  ORF type:complete len:160 (+),score=9.36 TRINITY_DN10929_c0_g1_i11:232-711(+)
MKYKAVLCPVCKFPVSAYHGAHTNCKNGKRRRFVHRFMDVVKPERQERSAEVPPPTQPQAVQSALVPSDELPSLLDISSPALYLFRVPSRGRLEWARTFQFIIRNVLFSNNILEWTRYFVMTRCCLQVLPRGGRKHRRQVEDFVSNNCRRFRTIEWIDM